MLQGVRLVRCLIGTAFQILGTLPFKSNHILLWAPVPDVLFLLLVILMVIRTRLLFCFRCWTMTNQSILKCQKKELSHYVYHSALLTFIWDVTSPTVQVCINAIEEPTTPSSFCTLDPGHYQSQLASPLDYSGIARPISKWWCCTLLSPTFYHLPTVTQPRALLVSVNYKRKKQTKPRSWRRRGRGVYFIVFKKTDSKYITVMQVRNFNNIPYSYM